MSASDEPALTVVRGAPTPEELAALVAVLAATASPPTPPAPRPRSSWAAHWRGVRAPLVPGPGAWQAAGR